MAPATPSAALIAEADQIATTRVLDADLKFRGYQNVYACDNSVFPVSPAANPSLTLAALAHRLAARLVDR